MTLEARQLSPLLFSPMLLSPMLLSAVMALGCGDRTRLEIGRSGAWDSVAFTHDPNPSNASASITELGSEAPSDAASGVVPAGGVRGRVIDFWGQGVPHVALDVDGDIVTSDEQGVFQVRQASETYDVSLVVHIDGEVRETYAWTFEGLTRRDPVLQVYRGLPPRRAELRLTRAPSTTNPSPCAFLAISGEHGHDAFAFGEDSRISFVWRGPYVTQASMEVLFWQPSSKGDCDEPRRYFSPSSWPLRLEPSRAYELVVADPPVTAIVPVATIAGEVSGTSREPVVLTVFARTSNGGTLPVPASPVVNGRWTGSVPVLEEATFVVAASRGGFGAFDYAVSYAMGVQPGTSDLQLELPTVPTLERPAADTQVARSAAFEWQPTGAVSLLSVAEEHAFATQYVVTRRSQTTLRDLSHLGAAMKPGAAYRWTVERHGSVASVDEWSNASALDSFSVDFAVPVGPKRASGHFARSALRSVSFDTL